jgi:predicted RNase H-like nuclease (RuvC/YqgF family)
VKSLEKDVVKLDSQIARLQTEESALTRLNKGLEAKLEKVQEQLREAQLEMQGHKSSSLDNKARSKTVEAEMTQQVHQ